MLLVYYVLKIVDNNELFFLFNKLHQVKKNQLDKELGSIKGFVFLMHVLDEKGLLLFDSLNVNIL